jgi:Zn-dependent protease/predicted transcriptional regulator
MGTRDAWTIFRAAGAPVRIHFTWLFVAAYLTFVFTGQFAQLARAADIQDVSVLLPPLVWGLLLTVLLFACVLLHELAHVWVARRGGAHVESITLMMLGGVSEIGEVHRPRLELRMSIAGPIASLLLAVVFYGLFRLSAQGPPDLQFGLYYLAGANLVIGLFNLLPAFPMDGGRILRSLLVRAFGRLRATQIATTVGKVLAVGLVLVGLLWGSFWLALIGFFIFIGGDAEYRALQAYAALRGLRVADFFTRKVAAVDVAASAAQAAAAMLEARTDVCFLLSGGAPRGLVTAAALSQIPVRDRSEVPVARVMQKLALVSLHDDLPTVLKMLTQERLDAVGVVDESTQLVGTLSRDDIARGLQLREIAAPPAAETPA